MREEFEVHENKCAVMHLYLEFWGMEHNFLKFILAINQKLLPLLHLKLEMLLLSTDYSVEMAPIIIRQMEMFEIKGKNITKGYEFLY